MKEIWSIISTSPDKTFEGENLHNLLCLLIVYVKETFVDLLNNNISCFHVLKLLVELYGLLKIRETVQVYYLEVALHHFKN